MKLILKLAVVLVVLIVGVAIAGVFYIDSIATAGVVKGAAYATETEADCNKIDVKITGGEVTISELDIKNPAAFREARDSFLIIHDGSAAISLGTLRNDEVEIEHVTLDGIDISLVGRDGKTNYEEIIASITRFQGETPAEPAEEGGKTFVIRTVTITNLRVFVDLDEDPTLGLVPVKWEEPLVIDEIVLTDVGGDGVPMEQITADLISDIMLQVVSRFGDQLGGFALDMTGDFANNLGLDALQTELGDLGLDDFDLSGKLEGFADIGGDLGDGVLDGIEGLGDGVNELGDALRDGISGGLLGGDDDEDE